MLAENFEIGRNVSYQRRLSRIIEVVVHEGYMGGASRVDGHVEEWHDVVGTALLRVARGGEDEGCCGDLRRWIILVRTG